MEGKKKKTLRFVKTLIMLHKQPIKAKNNNRVTVCFPSPTTSDTMKADRRFIHCLIYIVFCLLWILRSWFHPLWICLYLSFMGLTDRRTLTDGRTEGWVRILKNHIFEWKKVRDGSRNINAYAESNLSSVRDIRSFFDTGGRGGKLGGGGGGGGAGAGSPGEWRLFPKMPSASCII